jgi:hypothetical protein
MVIKKDDPEKTKRLSGNGQEPEAYTLEFPEGHGEQGFIPAVKVRTNL